MAASISHLGALTQATRQCSEPFCAAQWPRQRSSADRQSRPVRTRSLRRNGDEAESSTLPWMGGTPRCWPSGWALSCTFRRRLTAAVTLRAERVNAQALGQTRATLPCQACGRDGTVVRLLPPPAVCAQRRDQLSLPGESRAAANSPDGQIVCAYGPVSRTYSLTSAL
jgi:hypothetical protein